MIHNECCIDCGRPVEPWSAPADQWNAVTEHPDSGLEQGRGVILCTDCFTNRASILYGVGITLRVELWQKVCATHGYWPPCPDSSTYDPCEWVPKRADFERRLNLP